MKTRSLAAVSFVCLIASTGAEALNTVVTKWTPSVVQTNYRTLSIDLGQQLSEPGRYEVHFNFSKGRHGLDIGGVKLMANRKVLASDLHKGFAGARSIDNLYHLDLKKAPPAKSTLMTSIKGSGGTDSYGEIVIKKWVPKAVPESSANPIVASVVPAPRHWKAAEGECFIRGASIHVDKQDIEKLRPVAELFQQDLKTARLGSYPLGEQAGGKRIILKIGTIEQSPSKEAYKIEIGFNITITGNSETGVFYGTRTLLQMLNQKTKTGRLPMGVIVDWPDYAHRSLLLDVGRAPFPLPVLYDYLRMMAYYKMNELHLHLNDDLTHSKQKSDYSGFRVECETFPGLTSRDCFYTKKELKEFQKVARSMGITVVPEFDMPGHARAFTKVWPDLIYMEGGEKPKKGYLDFKNPETVRRLKLLIDEMIPVFDGPDIHIGTDEFRVGGWPSGKEFLELNDSLMKFINDMNKHVRSKGKNMRIWYGTDHIKSDIKPDKTIVLDIWNLDPATVAKVTPGHRFINSCEWASYIVPGVNYYGVNNSLVYQKWNPWNWGRHGSWNKDNATSMKIRNNPGLMGGKLNVWMDIGPGKVSMKEVSDLVQPSLQVFSERLWGIKGSEYYEQFKKRSAAALPAPTLAKGESISPDNSRNKE